jgi:outer membrane immunogenic protein
MRSLHLVCTAACVLGAASSALGADLAPGRTYTRAVPVVTSNWTGFYIGGVAGLGTARSEVNPVGANAFCNPALVGCPPALVPAGGIPADVGSALAVPRSINTNGTGGMLGGTLGYNWQFGQWLLGAETDLSWANLVGSALGTGGPVQITGVVAPGTAWLTTGAVEDKLKYFGTVRGRLGYVPVFAPNLLLFATGGLAYGRISSQTGIQQVWVGPCGALLGCPATGGAGSGSSVRAGWTVGGGAEVGFAQNWSLKAEYLYYDISGTSYPLAPLATTSSLAGVAAPFTTVALTTSTSDFKGSIVRFGLNYRIGNYASVVTK